jgi:hypothetical protein
MAMADSCFICGAPPNESQPPALTREVLEIAQVRSVICGLRMHQYRNADAVADLLERAIRDATPPAGAGEAVARITVEHVVAHAVVTPTCRANRTDNGALVEAMARIGNAYSAFVAAPGNVGVSWHFKLIRAAAPAVMLERPSDEWYRARVMENLDTSEAMAGPAAPTPLPEAVRELVAADLEFDAARIFHTEHTMHHPRPFSEGAPGYDRLCEAKQRRAIALRALTGGDKQGEANG